MNKETRCADLALAEANLVRAKSQRRIWRRRRVVGASLLLAFCLLLVNLVTAEAGRNERNRQQSPRNQDAPRFQQEQKKESEKVENRQERTSENSKDRGENDKGEKDKADKSEKDKNDKADNDGSDDDKKGRSGSKSANKGGSDNEASDRSKPPETVAEVFRRMLTPLDPVTPKAKRSHEIVSASTYHPGEILALNLKPDAIEKAERLRFTVNEPQRLNHARGLLTMLAPPPGMSTTDAVALLNRELRGESIGLNRIYRAYRAAGGQSAETPSKAREVRAAGAGGCDSTRCYGPAVIKWLGHHSNCATGVRVGLIDTAIDRHHVAFRDRRIVMREEADGPPPAELAHHGTGTLALLAGQPQSGTPGLIPNAVFLTANAFSLDGEGQPYSDTAQLLSALDWMQSKNAEVVNLSIAGPADDLLRTAIEQMSKKGTIMVAAAGNDGPTAAPVYPAAYPSVVAVTAIGRDMRAYRLANRGDYVDVAAPGIDIWTAVPQAREGYQSGTSFAAPYVTAMLASVYRDVQSKTKAGMLARLEVKDLGTPGRDPVYGRGLALAPAACAPPASAPVTADAWSSNAPSSTSATFVPAAASDRISPASASSHQQPAFSFVTSQ